ncbi:Enoyl-CoA delta isomerase 3 [Pseudocercospora fuligena]|uniref:Enoyl-CoA delta isomerase 3 n=1 Tax=Pseudocercospora fuligena TaxID=685502 RepID=A0A8H6RT16_9PEZI|nr:Enoyl-CoA delta isomerase 3 [Pseudocercospora fuligena]
MAKPTPSSILFDLPIRGEKDIGIGGKGQIICTQPQPKVYLLTFTNAPDNRLVTAFCKTLNLALDILQHRYPPGVVMTTSSIPKFYSNGMDIEHATFSGGYMPDRLYALWKRFLTYPMPTVAVINGHAFAGGLMLAMMHDYRIMNPHKGYLCLNEIELGAPLRPPMTAVFRMKLNGTVLRKMVLEAYRFKALEALEAGIVDSLGGVEQALKLVDEFQLVKKAQPGATGKSVYGELKREMWRETVELLDTENWGDEHVREAKIRERVKREDEGSLKRVVEWEQENVGAKAKL